MWLTITQVSDALNVSGETVRLWIVGKKLDGVFSPDHGRYEIKDEDLEKFCRSSKRYHYIAPSRGSSQLSEPEPESIRNSEGYPDPTAFVAMRRIDGDERCHKLIKTLLNIIDLAGFHLDGRITLVDKKSGKIYR